jgi:hypothetical protein
MACVELGTLCFAVGDQACAEASFKEACDYFNGKGCLKSAVFALTKSTPGWEEVHKLTESAKVYLGEECSQGDATACTELNDVPKLEEELAKFEKQKKGRKPAT